MNTISKGQHFLLNIYIFLHECKSFTVTCDQFNASLLNKNINFLFLKNLTGLKLLKSVYLFTILETRFDIRKAIFQYVLKVFT